MSQMGYWTRKVRRCSSYRSVIAWPELPSSRWDRMWLSSTLPTAPRASVPVCVAIDAVPTGRRGSALTRGAADGGTTTRSAGRQTLVSTERSPTTIHATGAEVKCQLHTLAGARLTRALRVAGPLGRGWRILDALHLPSHRPPL